MGRRDEPKIDELQRLLRRLEYMEVDKTSGSAQEPEPEAAPQAPGYVGALRGAPTFDDHSDKPYAEPESDALGSHETADRSRSSSTAPVVIGATTAAVVSSMVVVGLLLWTQDKDGSKSAERQRLNFVAPMEAGEDGGRQTRPVRSNAPAATPDPSVPDTESLLQRADQHIRSGKLTQARSVLEEAARRGSGIAALTLGAMYDPTRVAEFGNLGVQADPTLARAWYERANALGVVEASNRLSELARR